MNDCPHDAAPETPIQRALRMKKAALGARPKAPGGNTLRRETVAGVTAGASKPWMKR